MKAAYRPPVFRESTLQPAALSCRAVTPIQQLSVFRAQPTPGLAHLERALSVSCPASAIAQTTLRTSSIKRLLRRDFYWTSLRLFFARGETSARAALALSAAEAESKALAQRVLELAADATWPIAPEIYRVRVLSPRCARFLRAMQRTDEALARLLALELSGRLSRRERLEIGRGALRALDGVKLATLDPGPVLTKRPNP